MHTFILIIFFVLFPFVLLSTGATGDDYSREYSQSLSYRAFSTSPFQPNNPHIPPRCDAEHQSSS